MNLLKTFFYSLKKSLLDPKYYKDIAKSKFWFSLKYIWFLLFILTFIKAIFVGGRYLQNRPHIQPGVNKIFKSAENLYPRELELKVKNGQLFTNVKEPYVFNIDKPQDKDLLIIDTKGSIENYPEYNTYVLATKNAVVYPSKSSDNRIDQTSVFYFRDIKQNFTFNKKIYDNLLNKARPYTYKAVFFVDWAVYVGLLLFVLFGSFFALSSTLLGLVFLTFFVWLVNLIFKKEYSYGTLYRMGMHASTGPILIVELVKYFKLPFHSFYSLIFFVWMMIILFTVKSKK